MTDLREALQDIRGIGDAKADAIIDVLEETSSNPENPKLERAIEKAQDGNDREAAIWLRRYDRSKD